MNAPGQRSRVPSHITLRALILVPLLIMPVVLAACAQDPLPTHTPFPTYTPLPTLAPLPTHTPLPTLAPLPTHTPYPEPTATPTPTPTPTPRPIPTPDPSAPVSYGVEQLNFTNLDGFPTYQLRMGNLTAWGYNAGDRVQAREGDGIVITIRVIDELRIPRITNPSRLSTGRHALANEELGFNIELKPDQESSLVIRNSDCETSGCGSFQGVGPGTYVIDDPKAPGSLGRFVIVVVE